jgi:hypothetical protein
MYTEWSSLTSQIATNINGSQQQSTLNKFNPLISRDVTAALVKQLSANLGITQKPEPSPFKTGKYNLTRSKELFSHKKFSFRSRSRMVYGCYCIWIIIIT